MYKVSIAASVAGDQFNVIGAFKVSPSLGLIKVGAVGEVKSTVKLKVE